eukprot:9478789-Pyramimonas_sp.AAC.1
MEPTDQPAAWVRAAFLPPIQALPSLERRTRAGRRGQLTLRQPAWQRPPHHVDFQAPTWWPLRAPAVWDAPWAPDLIVLPALTWAWPIRGWHFPPATRGLQCQDGWPETWFVPLGREWYAAPPLLFMLHRWGCPTLGIKGVVRFLCS